MNTIARTTAAVASIAMAAALAACGTVHATAPAPRSPAAAAAPARPWAISSGQGLQNALTPAGAPVFAGARLQSALTAGTAYAK